MVNLRPMTITAAKAWVAETHRHLPKVQGGLFAVGLEDLMGVVGCAIVGRPVARALNDGYTAEVTRVAVLPGVDCANSRLYGACRRAAKALGYRRMYTYTLATEPGTSLLASGWKVDGHVKGRQWSCPSRPREDAQCPEDKIRWRIQLRCT